MSISIQASQSDVPNRKSVIDSLLQTLERSLKQADQLTPIPIQAAAAESQDSASYANRNPAIVRCILAHNKAHEEACESKLSSYDVRSQARLAFREALPPLIGRNNIRNFIACVTYGMAIELISISDGTRLLNAARAASSVLYQRSRQKAEKSVRKSAEKPRKSGVSRPENASETIENKEDTSENSSN